MTQPFNVDTTFTNPDGTKTRIVGCNSVSPDQPVDDFEFTVPDLSLRATGLSCSGGAAWVVDSSAHTAGDFFAQYYNQLIIELFSWNEEFLLAQPVPLSPITYPPRLAQFEAGDVITVRLGGSARMPDGSFPTEPGGTPGDFPSPFVSDNPADLRMPTLGGWNGGGDGDGGSDRLAGLGGGGCTEVWRNGDLWIVVGGFHGRAGEDTDIPVPYFPPGCDAFVDDDSVHYITGASVPSASDPPRAPIGPWDPGRTLASPGTAGGPHDGADASASAGGGGGGFGGGASGGNATATGLPGRHGGSLTPYTSGDPLPPDTSIFGGLTHLLWGAPEVTDGFTGGLSQGGNGAFAIAFTYAEHAGWSVGQILFGPTGATEPEGPPEG